MNGVFDWDLGGDVTRRASRENVSSRPETGQFEITGVIARRRLSRAWTFTDAVCGDYRIRRRLTVGADDAACNRAFALRDLFGLIGRLRLGRRLLRGSY